MTNFRQMTYRNKQLTLAEGREHEIVNALHALLCNKRFSITLVDMIAGQDPNVAVLIDEQLIGCVCMGGGFIGLDVTTRSYSFGPTSAAKFAFERDCVKITYQPTLHQKCILTIAVAGPAYERNKTTLIEQAKELTWGPTVYAPKSWLDAVEYALGCLGDTNRLASLGDAYAIKGLLWARDQMHETLNSAMVNRATSIDTDINPG